MAEPPITLIAGPTASGKSALALRLAEATSGEIINADALQLYRDLRILSARPAVDEEARAPHHLFGVADAADGWSVGRWLREAGAVLGAIAARGRPAIIIGGTGLYFMALTRGLAHVPAASPDVKTRIETLYDEIGEAAARTRLATVDPAAEARIAPADRQRLVRALTVAEATGKALSDWQADTAPFLPAGAWRGVVLEPPRAALFDRCDARLIAMLKAGAIEEAAALTARALDPRLPAMKAVGLREFAACAAGAVTREAALAAAQAATRQYAKRQLTWFRNQAPDWPRISEVDGEDQWRAFKKRILAGTSPAKTV